MTENYTRTCERLWELLDASRDKWITTVTVLPALSPQDKFTEVNPDFRALVHRVEAEFDYGMSDHQCSWSVVMFLHHDWESYKRKHGIVSPVTPAVPNTDHPR